jgi:hypothetical protein
MKNSVFFPQGLLDLLAAEGKVELDGQDIVVPGDGFRYRMLEAVRVVREVTTGEDPHDLCGRVRSRDELQQNLGAEILGNSMLVEEWAYDVIPGLLGEPVGDIPSGATRPEEDVLVTLQQDQAVEA